MFQYAVDCVSIYTDIALVLWHTLGTAETVQRFRGRCCPWMSDHAAIGCRCDSFPNELLLVYRSNQNIFRNSASGLGPVSHWTKHTPR